MYMYIVSLCVCILFSFQIWKPKNGWKQRLTVIRFSPGSLKTSRVFYSHSYSHRMGHLMLLTKLSKVFYCHWWSYMYIICPIMHILKQNIKGILISSDECILFHSFGLSIFESSVEKRLGPTGKEVFHWGFGRLWGCVNAGTQQQTGRGITQFDINCNLGVK